MSSCMFADDPGIPGSMAEAAALSMRAAFPKNQRLGATESSWRAAAVVPPRLHDAIVGGHTGSNAARTGHRGANKRSSYKHVPHREKPPHMVARRNARERRRVQAVNSAFIRLRRHIPNENKKKRLSKVKTLRTAIDYIQQMQAMISDYDRRHGGAGGTGGQAGGGFSYSNAGGVGGVPGAMQRSKENEWCAVSCCYSGEYCSATDDAGRQSLSSMDSGFYQ